MTQKFNSGFTIIEVVFFLAISGLMAVGLLAGMGNTVNVHRYRDSAASLQSQLQHEFTYVENISNDRDNRRFCSASAGISTITSATTSPRGTTDCMMLGKLVAVEGSKISSYPVIGYGTIDEGKSDIVNLQNLTLRVDTEGKIQTGNKWGGEVVYPISTPGGSRGESRNFYLLIVRSPKSGGIYAFSSSSNPNTPAKLKAMVREDSAGNDYGRTRQILCIKKDGFVASSMLGVSLEANITNPNGIQILSNDTESKC